VVRKHTSLESNADVNTCSTRKVQGGCMTSHDSCRPLCPTLAVSKYITGNCRGTSRMCCKGLELESGRLLAGDSIETHCNHAQPTARHACCTPGPASQKVTSISKRPSAKVTCLHLEGLNEHRAQPPVHVLPYTRQWHILVWRHKLTVTHHVMEQHWPRQVSVCSSSSLSCF
jgi:hypothetical protein